MASNSDDAICFPCSNWWTCNSVNYHESMTGLLGRKNVVNDGLTLMKKGELSPAASVASIFAVRAQYEAPLGDIP